MSDMTVKEFAGKVGRDVSRLLEQMKDAGLPHQKESDAVSEEDKQRLLDHLTKSHGGGRGPRNRITLTRNTRSKIRSGDRGKTIEVQVRKKRTYVKRDAEPAEEAPVEETGPRQLVGDMADKAQQQAAEQASAQAAAASEAAQNQTAGQESSNKAAAPAPQPQAPGDDIPDEPQVEDDEPTSNSQPFVEPPPKEPRTENRRAHPKKDKERDQGRRGRRDDDDDRSERRRGGGAKRSYRMVDFKRRGQEGQACRASR